jgi:hypothetical protein
MRALFIAGGNRADLMRAMSVASLRAEEVRAAAMFKGRLRGFSFALGAQVLKGFGLRIGGLPRGGDGHDDKVVWLVFDNGFSVCFKHLGDGAAVCNLLAVAPQQDVLI